MGAWWAYRRGFLTPLDLRVWLACFETVARRYGLPRGQPAHFSRRELRELVGNDSDEEIRRSLSRLSARGFVVWSERWICVGSPGQSYSEQETAELWEYLAQVPNHARRVPVPRRVIRLLARTGTRALLATMFGHLLRCCYYRGRECRPTGTCKASWIATVFAVDIRNVKAARKSLVDQGLLHFESVGQRFLNRFGPLVTVNLDWAPPALARGRLAPPGAVRRDISPPLLRERELLRKSGNQNPAGAGGFAIPVHAHAEQKPSFRHVVLGDLTDAGRLMCLFEQACAAGYVQCTDSDRLNFFAMAEHARTVATRNAPGLFAANVRHRRWSVIRLADEDRAQRRLVQLACRATTGEVGGRPSEVHRVRKARIAASGRSGALPARQPERVDRVLARMLPALMRVR
jgi:hypothetical protein